MEPHRRWPPSAANDLGTFTDWVARDVGHAGPVSEAEFFQLARQLSLSCTAGLSEAERVCTGPLDIVASVVLAPPPIFGWTVYDKATIAITATPVPPGHWRFTQFDLHMLTDKRCERDWRACRTSPKPPPA